MRLAIPGRFVSLCDTQNCIVLDLSGTGARLALARPVGCGQHGYVAVANFELFGSVVRIEHGRRGGLNAMTFDEPIDKAQVIAIRHFAEGFADREKAALREQVRRWVSGER
ncbi:MAG: hypothetical protein ACKO01_01285 [Erythrobacter sp.]